MIARLDSITGKLGRTRKDNGNGATVAPASSDPAPARSSAKAMPSILASDIRITGDLKGDGEIQIEGRLDGNLAAQSVTVGAAGVVVGSIKADTVVVGGAVEGDIKARDVTLTKTARVQGGLSYGEVLDIERGARYSGKAACTEPSMEKPAGPSAVAGGRHPTNAGASKPSGAGIGADIGAATNVGSATS